MPLPTPLSGPVPAEIARAHTIFLSSAGADPNFPVDANRSYNELAALLRARTHFQLVDSVASADLVFRLHGVDPVTSITGADGAVSSITSPAFELTIVDARTNAALWTITSPVFVRGRGKVFDRWFEIAVGNLVSRVKVLAAQPLSEQEQSDLTTIPKTHGRRNLAIAASALVVLGVGSALLIHHEYENGLANQKASADAFCTANGIPLAQCPGG